MSYYNSYDPYKDVNEIYKKGLAYQRAKNEEEKKKIHQSALQHYNALTQNGYDDVAEQLRKADSSARKQLSDQYGMQGKTGVRDYMKKYGAQYGLSESDIDKNIGWNDATKEISLYGQNIGKPASVVNGASYDNVAKIKANFDNVMKNLGITRSSDTLYNQNMEGATAGYEKADNATANAEKLIGENRKTRSSDMQKYNQEYGKYTNELYNPNTYTSRNAEAIRSAYREKGDIAAEGAVADSAASNSGNIDSFAAANAKRQQLAFENAANEAILADYNARMDRIQNAMNNLGIQQQARWGADSGDVTQMLSTAAQYGNTATGRTSTANTIFSNSEAKKQATHEREMDQKNYDLLNKKTYAEVTGRNPQGWNALYSQNPFFDENGNLKKTDIDYQQLLNNVRAQIANESNAAEREKLKEREQQLLAARYQKVLGGLGFERYANTLEMPTYSTELTDPAKQWRDENAVARETLASDSYNREQSLAAEQANNEANRQMQMQMNAANNQNALDQILAEKGYQNTGTVTGTSADNAYSEQKARSEKTTDGKKFETKLQEIIKNFNSYAEKEYGKDDFGNRTYEITSAGTSGYNVPGALQEKFVLDVLKDTTLSADQKMLAFEMCNIPDSVLDTVNTDRHYAK